MIYGTGTPFSANIPGISDIEKKKKYNCKMLFTLEILTLVRI